MHRGQVVFVGFVLSVAWGLAVVRSAKVVAIVVKNPNSKGAPVLSVDGLKVHTYKLDIPKQALAQQGQASQKPLTDQTAVPVLTVKPKQLFKLTLVKQSDKDTKQEREQRLKDAQYKKAMYPCEDYSPTCHYYVHRYNMKPAQCRDVWSQRNCRETCGLCKVPVGVYLGCQDLEHCLRLAKSQCVHDWVRETCKSKCGSCDGSPGGGWSRAAASGITIGKKKSMVGPEKVEKKEDKPQKIHNIKHLSKLQTEVKKVENPTPKKKTVSESTASDDDKDDDKDNDDNDEDDEDDEDEPDNDEEHDSSSGSQPDYENMEDAPAKKVQDKPVHKVEEKKPVVRKDKPVKKVELINKKEQKKVVKVHDKKPAKKEQNKAHKAHDEPKKNVKSKKHDAKIPVKKQASKVSRKAKTTD